MTGIGHHRIRPADYAWRPTRGKSFPLNQNVQRRSGQSGGVNKICPGEQHDAFASSPHTVTSKPPNGPSPRTNLFYLTCWLFGKASLIQFGILQNLIPVFPFIRWHVSGLHLDLVRGANQRSRISAWMTPAAIAFLSSKRRAQTSAFFS
jgi:hypothetical protein